MSLPAPPISARRAELKTRSGLLAAALVVVALPLALAGCGDEESSEARQADAPAQEQADGPVDISGTDPVGQEIGGSSAPLATCEDWNGASEGERLATVNEIRIQLAAQDSGIIAPELTDEEGEELFDGACEPSWAAGFRLYKLYARGAGFVELKREIEERQGE